MTKPTARQRSAPQVKRDPEIKRRARFVKEYLIDLNGAKAAIRAGYSDTSARQIAAELLKVQDISDAIASAMEKRAQRLELTADDVLKRWWSMANADPTELSELRRCCCRYCWGKDFKYQRTPREMRETLAQFARDKLKAQAENKEFNFEFDEQGGIGFDPRRDPNVKCPECFGEGEERPFFKDTRDASPGAKLLFAGVEQTQHGLKIRTHSQTDALKNVAQHLGMLQQNVKHTNDPKNPMPAGVVLIPMKDPAADESGGK